MDRGLYAFEYMRIVHISWICGLRIVCIRVFHYEMQVQIKIKQSDRAVPI